MLTASAPRSWAWLGAIAFAATIAIPGCNSDSNPNAPTPIIPPPVVTQPPPTTTTPPPTPSNPTPNGAVTIGVNPNPVPHSGAPITDSAGCASVLYTWYYDQVMQETGGAAVTFTNRIDLFDDRETNNSAVNVAVSANGTTTIRSRWCSSTRSAHSAQTRWTGTDAAGRAVVVMGPRVSLMNP